MFPSTLCLIKFLTANRKWSHQNQIHLSSSNRHWQTHYILRLFVSLWLVGFKFRFTLAAPEIRLTASQSLRWALTLITRTNREVGENGQAECCCCCCHFSGVQPQRRQPTRLPRPWDSPGKKLEWVAISFSIAWKWKVKVKSLSRVWLFEIPWTEWGLLGSSAHGIFQARVLEWGAIEFLYYATVKTKFR